MRSASSVRPAAIAAAAAGPGLGRPLVDRIKGSLIRRALGLTQTDVAKLMNVTKGRVSQIENGTVSTVDVVARYVAALGGTLQVSAVFGDDHLLLRSPATA